jgi:hypothetical protein
MPLTKKIRLFGHCKGGFGKCAFLEKSIKKWWILLYLIPPIEKKITNRKKEEKKG